MSPLDALSWLCVGLAYVVAAVGLLIVCAGVAVWVRSRVDVARWLREQPPVSLWRTSGNVYRVKVADDRVVVQSLDTLSEDPDSTPRTLMLAVAEFEAMARAGTWRRA